MWHDWVEDSSWVNIGDPKIQATYGGWFHVYAFTMTVGILLAIGFSFYKFKRQRLSADNLMWGAAIIVPVSLFGASFFGKLNAEGIGINADDVGFWGLFAFWKEGMSIHGGVLFGLIAGLLIFGIVGRHAHVSLWSYFDAIVPNILLGQALGRWGNFFNHELVGAPMYALGRVDISSAGRFDANIVDINDLIRQGLHVPNNFIARNTLAYHDGVVYQMMPIFLIESLSLLALWLVITFVIPNLGKWFGPKPWKVQFYLFQLTPLPPDASLRVRLQTRLLHARQKREIWDAIAINKNKPKEVVYAPDSDSLLIGRWRAGKALMRANNPNGYWLMKVGFQGSMYFFGWNLIRFFLEMSRPDNHLFIMYEKNLSLLLIGLMAALGFLGMILTQIGLPQLTRRFGWAYEQDYLYAPVAKPTSLRPKEIARPTN